MTEKFKRKNISLTKKDIDRMNDLIDAEVECTASAVIRKAVKELHKRELGDD